MAEEDEEAQSQREHEKTLAIVQARKEAFAKSPVWFTIWDVTTKALKIIFWLSFWLIVAQCHCDCIIK